MFSGTKKIAEYYEQEERIEIKVKNEEKNRAIRNHFIIIYRM